MSNQVSIADSWILALCAYMIHEGLPETRISPEAMEKLHRLQPFFEWKVDEETRDIVVKFFLPPSIER